MVRTWSGGVALACALAVVACKRSEAAPDQGRQLFMGSCARCHGAEGTGGLPVSDGGPSPRNFTDHAFQQSHTNEQIRQTIVNGKGTAMPAFGPAFDDTQLDALVRQVRSFDPEMTR